jgi:hypothetical protein
MKMTPKEFEEKMKEIFKGEYDEDDAHENADMLMMNLLIKLGYEKGVDIFDEADKWYS